MTKTNILTLTQNIKVINSHTYEYIYIHICTVYVGNDKKLMSLHDNKLYTYSFTIRQIFSNRLGRIFTV